MATHHKALSHARTTGVSETDSSAARRFRDERAKLHEGNAFADAVRLARPLIVVGRAPSSL
ncbi:MAG TPA: hypothetical protein VMV01_08535, partial [Planctomycetota bacterium]|nr:hypothetical protein [Planctomycetota bacterium]